MDKDLIIAGASNYDWNKLKYWVNSIKKSGFTGDVVICATNITKETIEKLSEQNVSVYAYGKDDGNGGFSGVTKLAPHVERFFYIWNFLSQYSGNYNNVIVTDARDVVFQTNPSDYLRENLKITNTLICSSEGLLYKDEPWGDKNMLETFGPFFHQIFREEMIYNVGTIAGASEEVTALMLMIFQLSTNRATPIVDQAVFNFIINQIPYKSEVQKTNNEDGWAIQLGTSRKAVEAGFGEIGQRAKDNPELLKEYDSVYRDVHPVINDHIVSTPGGKKYCIVHQWDRVPELKDKFEEIYGD